MVCHGPLVSERTKLIFSVQSAFTALNIEPDDLTDDEIDNTKELQVCAVYSTVSILFTNTRLFAD